jgi:DnaK suppressor protein
VLSTDEKELIKQKLLTKILRTEENISDLKELTKPISPENAIGRISRMDAINNKSVNEATLRNAKQKLVQLERSLMELDSDSFGLCGYCGKSIELPKLLVMPENKLCVSCVKAKIN